MGSYKNPDYQTATVEVNSFLFEGTTADLTDAAHYRTIDYPGTQFNFAHSTMGGLVVGNYDSPLEHGAFGLPLGPGHAFLYDIASDTFLTDIAYPGARSNTAYGIWYNGGTSYTICGGYSLDPVNNFDNPDQPIGHAFLVDYDMATRTFSHWATFDYPKGIGFLTHFEGISSVEKGVFITASSGNLIGSESGSPANVIAFNAANGVFVTSGNRNGIHANSIFSNTLLGIALAPGANQGQAPPVLTSIATGPLGIQITDTLTSKPNTTFVIELFANAGDGPSGRVYLGSVKVHTNGRGHATFAFIGVAPPLGANFYTATATDPLDNTSTFSAPLM